MVKLQPKYDTLFLRITIFFSIFIKFILNALLILLCLALIVGVVKSGYDLFTSLGEPLERILQKMLLDTVFIVALLEISITILGYLKDGQVHVRYIVDTILIIMLNEIVALWFRHPSLQDMIGISVVVVALAGIRIAVTRFAPRTSDG
jgi:uncharacterized membrane protein (DUF373 family)